jgi:hypothetical protein
MMPLYRVHDFVLIGVEVLAIRGSPRSVVS